MRITESGQVTIPKHLRDRFAMHGGVEVEIKETDEGLLIQKRENGQNPTDEVASTNDGDGMHPVDRLYGILSRNKQHPVDRVAGILDGTEFDVDEYIEEIRGR